MKSRSMTGKIFCLVDITHCMLLCSKRIICTPFNLTNNHDASLEKGSKSVLNKRSVLIWGALFSWSHERTERISVQQEQREQMELTRHNWDPKNCRKINWAFLKFIWLYRRRDWKSGVAHLQSTKRVSKTARFVFVCAPISLWTQVWMKNQESTLLITFGYHLPPPCEVFKSERSEQNVACSMYHEDINDLVRGNEPLQRGCLRLIRRSPAIE